MSGRFRVVVLGDNAREEIVSAQSVLEAGRIVTGQELIRGTTGTRNPRVKVYTTNAESVTMTRLYVRASESRR